MGAISLQEATYAVWLPMRTDSSYTNWGKMLDYSGFLCQDRLLSGGVLMSRKRPELEFAMTARRTRLLLTGLVGLLVALATTTAPGAIVHGNAARPLDAVESGLARLFVTEFLDSQASVDGMAGPVPLSSDPSPEGHDPPTLQEVEDLLAAVPSGCQPRSISQSSGSGFANSAIPSATCDVPQAALVARLLDEIQLAFANPPLEVLLPPPRWSRVLRLG